MSPLPGMCSIADMQEMTDIVPSLNGKFFPSARTACKDSFSIFLLLFICHFNASRLMSTVITREPDSAQSVGRIE
jgi:hypothetical protein